MAEAAPHRRSAPSGRNRPTLLVVDDEPEVLRSIYDLFRLDYRVLTAGRGAEALERLEREDVSVIMSDQRMPEMSGVEFLSRARTIRPEATRLLITGYADLKAVIDAINEGHVFRYIAKPWDPEELGTVIRQAVEHHDLIVEKQRLIEELREANTRLAEANRMKANFIEVASHELNTPVTIVLGMAELWKLTQGTQPDDDAANGWVDRILSAGRRLASTVERMLKLLHADRLAPTLDAEPVELAPLVGGVIEDLQPYLDARRQQVELHIEPDLGSAEVEREKIADALSNLVINAIKFTPDEGRIRVSAGPDGADAVAFEVVDEGVGIAPRECELIFEPFFTGFDTMHHSSGDFQFGKRGIGLGLSLVRTFVEMHGGTVSCCSEPGHGSTFRIRLPRHPAPGPNGVDTSQLPAESPDATAPAG